MIKGETEDKVDTHTHKPLQHIEKVTSVGLSYTVGDGYAEQ